MVFCSFFIFTLTDHDWYVRCPFCFASSRPPYTIVIGGGSKFLVIIVILIRRIYLSLLGLIIRLLVRGKLIIGIIIIVVYACVTPFIWAILFYNFLFWFCWFFRWSIRVIYVILWCDFIANTFIFAIHFIVRILFIILFNIVTLHLLICVFVRIFLLFYGWDLFSSLSVLTPWSYSSVTYLSSMSKPDSHSNIRLPFFSNGTF